MLFYIVLLTVTCILEAEGAPTESGREENCSTKGSPLTGHLLKFLNHFDDSIIGFHLVVPRDDLIVNNYVDKPSQVGKILEYVTQINYLRNMIENDPEVSLKRKNERAWFGKSSTTPTSRVTNASDPHHTDILIFSQMSHQQPDFHNASKKSEEEESVIFVPYPRNLDQNNEPQNYTDIYSKPVGYKTNAYLDSKSKNALRANKLVNYSVLKKFEDGLRVYPLISVSQRNDSIDCFTGKANCSQQEICFLGRRIRSKPKTDNIASESSAFLVRPRDSSNPSILLIPKSMDKMSPKASRDPLSEEIVSETSRKADIGDELIPSMTFLAPLLESALILPMKTINEEWDNSQIIDNRILSKYYNHLIKKRDTVWNISENQDGCYKCKKDDSMNTISYNNSNLSGNSSNDTTCYDNSDSCSFADILRLSISDLVNGVDSNTSSFGSIYENDEVMTSNSTLNDYNMYFLVNPEQTCCEKIQQEDNPSSNMSDPSNILYSSPKSKVNKASISDFDSSNFIGLADYWPFILSQRRNKTDFEKQKNDFFSSTFDETDAFYDLNSFYKHKIVQILSHAKKGKCVLNTRKRKRGWNQYYENGKLATIDSGNKFLIKYIPKHFISDSLGISQRNNFTSNRMKKSVDESSELGQGDITKAMLYNLLKHSSEFSSELNNPNALKDKLVELKENNIFVPYENSKSKKIDRINRSSSKILLIPQVDRNIRLLIVYPYQKHKNKKFRTIVSKSVKKKTGNLTQRRNKPTLPPFSLSCTDDRILQKFINVSKGPDFTVQLDKKFLKDINWQTSGKTDPAGKTDSKNIRILDGVLKPVSYNEKDEGDSDQKFERKSFSQPNTFLSLRSPLSNFVESEPLNLTDSTSTDVKFPVNISDLQAVKLLQRVTAFPPRFSTKSNYSDSPKNYKDLSLLRNLTAVVTLDALKSLRKVPPVSEDSTNPLSTTEFQMLIDTSNSEILNTSNLHPFHSSNGFRVSNATNLLIKLTEFKVPNAYHRLKNSSNTVESEEPKLTGYSTDSPVTTGYSYSKLILMQKPSEPSLVGVYRKNLNSTEKQLAPFFKISKTFTSALVSNEAKVLNNYSQPIESNEEPILQSTPAFYEVQVPRTNNETGQVNSTAEQQQNVHHAPNVYTFTEPYQREYETHGVPTGISSSRIENSLVHSTRPWAAAATVTPTYEDDDDSPEEPEDSAVGSMYPDFAPVISVNIFPILGGWRRPQIEATSLIKELFRKTPKKVEEEQLPTYLSELFDVKKENNKTQNKLYNTTQRKLDAILSGQCSVNDILKMKVQNILQLSTKPTKGTRKNLKTTINDVEIY